MLNSLYSWRPRIVLSYHFCSYLNLLTLLNFLAAMLELDSEVDSPGLISICSVLILTENMTVDLKAQPPYSLDP